MDFGTGLLVVLPFGFLLGLKHATDADHVAAVANTVSKEQDIWKTVWIGVSWGAGHSVPLLILGTVILALSDIVLNRYESVVPYLEIAVGIMLVYIGISTASNVMRDKLNGAGHHDGIDDEPKVADSKGTVSDDGRRAGGFSAFGKPVLRGRSFAIGIVHGLAGSAAVMVGFLAMIESVWAGLFYILLFSVGTMLAMGGLTIGMALPFRASSTKQTLHSIITLASAALSFVVGVILIAEMVFDTVILPF